jgi:hypothetical protein
MSYDHRNLQVFIREGSTWSLLNSFRSSEPIGIVEWSADGSTLLWIDSNQNLAIWDLSKSQPIVKSIPSVSGFLDRACLSPDGKWFAVVGGNLVTYGQCDKQSNTTIGVKAGHCASLAFLSNCSLLIAHQELSQLNVLSGARNSLGKLRSSVSALAINCLVAKVALLHEDNHLSIWSLDRRKIVVTSELGPGVPEAVAWSTDGKLLACELIANCKTGDPSSLNRIVLVNPKSGKLLDTFKRIRGFDESISFDPLGKKLYVAILGERLSTWKFSDRTSEMSHTRGR